MATVKLIKLGTKCADTATKNNGAVTHLNINGSGHQTYLFQPKKLNPDSGLPVNRLRLDATRLNGIKEGHYTEVELPMEMIGQGVEDDFSGYKGVVIGLTIHLNGCVHYVVQAPGHKKDGSPIEAIEVDPRSCVGYDPSSSPPAPTSPGDQFTNT